TCPATPAMSIPLNGAAATIKYRCFVFDPPKEGDLTIPPSIMELLPGSDISVEQVLQHVFPPVDPDLPAGEPLDRSAVDHWFSLDEPMKPDAEILKRQIMPCESMRSALNENLPYHRSAGVRSIIFQPDKRTTPLLYPLWILTWWDLVSQQRQKQQLWIGADTWISTNLKSSNHPIHKTMLLAAR
ncbi:hypothetical protein FRC11_014373, partial [Ceratobasidium sp. 423]